MRSVPVNALVQRLLKVWCLGCVIAVPVVLKPDCACRVLVGDMSGVAAGSADAATDVQLKICRDGKVQKVVINLAEDHGLGTRRLVHWCGAQFQVRPCIPAQSCAPSDMLTSARILLKILH